MLPKIFFRSLQHLSNAKKKTTNDNRIMEFANNDDSKRTRKKQLLLHYLRELLEPIQKDFKSLEAEDRSRSGRRQTGAERLFSLATNIIKVRELIERNNITIQK